jgi:hypothetical protein
MWLMRESRKCRDHFLLEGRYSVKSVVYFLLNSGGDVIGVKHFVYLNNIVTCRGYA